MPLASVLPFVVYLLLVAFLPLAAHRFWERNRNKLILAAAFAVGTAVYLLAAQPHGASWLGHAAMEYVAFIAVMISLYITTGGILLRGSLAGTPIANTVMLGVGALLASLIGTTGASMLLIRPVLRANASRQRKAHVIIFFIFLVSNIGGMLTPLGDPPLYLGYLRGVPFTWTLNLALPWAFMIVALLLAFNAVDQVVFNREERERAGSQLEEVQRAAEPLRIEGRLNLLWLAGVVAVIFLSGRFGAPLAVQVGGMLAFAGLSWVTTARSIRSYNQFSWHPIGEVAAVFAGVFVTMIPALRLLETRGAELGIAKPWQFFWSTGLLSSVLDNAPTYLATSALAVGVVNGADPAARLDAEHLSGLAAHPLGVPLLLAISCASVAMGAMTYIGNGPNFLVKAVAEQGGVKMPGFFTYLLWSGAILIPVFVATTAIFFRA